ncbi:MAG: universal stress protein, partial [Dehalococcoidia bacterium]
MYQKILIPLDKSKESETVLWGAQQLLDADGEAILLHVIPAGLGGSGGFSTVGDTAQRRGQQAQA